MRRSGCGWQAGSSVTTSATPPSFIRYKDAATLDLLSEGRFELGIGAGWMKAEYEMTGISFDPPGVRLARMEEAVRIVKGLATSAGPFDFSGQHYQIAGLEGAPKPVQRPLPPLYIGGGGKRLLTFAAREADIVGLSAKALPDGSLDILDITAESARRKVGWIREAAIAASSDPELNILIFVFELTDDRHGTAERLAADWPGMTAEDLLASPHVLLGTPEEMAADLRQRREAYGLSYIVLNTGVEEQIAPFGEVVSLLAGQ